MEKLMQTYHPLQMEDTVL